MPRKSPVYEPVAPAPDPAGVWADGAMPLAAAARFAGVGRSKLYELMDAGEVVWSVPAGQTRRLVARRSLVAWLARSANGGG